MIDEKRIKMILQDIREHCKKNNGCFGCKYKRICYENLPFLWNDDEIENMAVGFYKLLNNKEG